MSNKQREIFDKAQAMLRCGDMNAAATLAEGGLAEFPDDANLMCVAARAAIASRQLDDARQHARSAVRKHPGFALAHDVLGEVLLVDGKPQEALEAFERALQLEPQRPGLAEKIARAAQLLDGSGDPAPGQGIVGGRLKRRQMAFADQIREAVEHEQRGESDKAEAVYRAILKADPEHVEASRRLAGIAVAHEHFREAIIFLRRALELAPDYSRAWVDLANAQRQLEEFDDALESARKVVELSPGRAEAHLLLASVLSSAGRYEEAIEAYETVLELSPDKAGAMCGMAHQLKTIGRRDEAIAQYRASIAVRGNHAEAYWSLANLKTFRFEESEVEAMHALLDADDLDDEGRCQVHNALGLEYEARRDYDQAFENFERCNRLRRKAESYDPVETEMTNDRIIAQFDAEFLAQGGGPDLHPTPIFVVGMPRSGSTLIEQILASHSMVEGTHELSDLSRVLLAMRQRSRRPVGFPDVVAPLRSSGWARIGRKYLESTAKHREGAAFFIDKNPNNFVFAGLIKLAMPNARIINARRHPLDSCLGTYKQLFASGQPFSYDLTELGEYYLQYQRIMDHWQRVLPGFVLDVHYENVVADLETEVRRLLEFCGLPFEESCLRFHETERAVKTASSEQVRRPIYSTSVNLWRNYEAQLATLVHIMEPLLAGLPEKQRPFGDFQVKR